MNCRKAEGLLLKSVDGRLDERSGGLLARHLEACRDNLDVAPRPHFWQRLEPRLREETELVPLLFWERWSLRAIPVFLALVVLLGGILFFAPQSVDLGQSATLLLENRDSLSETQVFFETDKPETRSMMLLFASVDERAPARRPRP
jgi:hypothetical protein